MDGAPSDVMLAILADFDRAPVKRRGEFGHFPSGVVLRKRIGHYDQRPWNALIRRGLVAWFTRCGCEYSCTCDGNGYYITAAGRAARSAT